MLSTEKRRHQIVEELERDHILTVSELSSRLGISEVSIRRDLEHLQERSLLKRIRGGAVLINDCVSDTTLTEKEQLNLDRKERIGRAAATLVEKGDRLILDSGTTPLQVAKQMVHLNKNNLGNITIITNSLPIVGAIGSHPNINLILLGGIYLHEYEVVVGPSTIDHLKGLHADKLFLGTDGLTLSHGITTANLLEAEVDRAMVKIVKEVIVVSDSSKIGVAGLVSIMPILKITKLITDTDAPTDFVSALEENGIEVILV
jgi:DeoR/GlpR family transcriptional regulator of sugar metabolism